jgi:hypothetical protein
MKEGQKEEKKEISIKIPNRGKERKRNSRN